MRNEGKRNVLGVGVDVVDYAGAVQRIVEAAETRQPLATTALAVHGVMTGVLDARQRYRLNQLDLVVPDGQPVRWALNLLHGARLADRVYGPDLMLALAEVAADRQLPIYLYGSRPDTLADLAAGLQRRFPSLRIVGTRPSRFRRLDARERLEVIEEIRGSGAAITFVGLGCPRQEVWAYELRERLGMPIVAVGAAFDFHAGSLPQAPARLQRAGLEWLFRLAQEPRRLWKRYLLLNPLFAGLLLLQGLRVATFQGSGGSAPEEELGFG